MFYTTMNLKKLNRRTVQKCELQKTKDDVSMKAHNDIAVYALHINFVTK